MKKKLMFVSALAVLMIFCACSDNESSESAVDESSSAQIYETSDGKLIYGDNSSEVSQGILIERNGSEKEVSAPDGSITFDEAEKLLNTCNFEALYLPQSVKEYKKYYFDTVTYNNSLYYSIDLYIELKGKKIFVGTNCLVACDGSSVLAKNWTSDYTSVKTNSSSSDSSLTELYGNTEITPNDALKVLASFSESQLGLKYSFSNYTFEVYTKLYDIKDVECYKIIPKLNYNNSLSVLSPYYITSDGSNKVIVNSSDKEDSYTEVK